MVLNASVNNAGVGLASFPVSFHLSVDQVVDRENDAQVGSCWVEGLGGADQASCSAVGAVVPEDLPQFGHLGEGPFYWIACADSIGGVDEGDETNNCRVHPEVFYVPEPGGVASASASGLIALIKAASTYSGGGNAGGRGGRPR